MKRFHVLPLFLVWMVLVALPVGVSRADGDEKAPPALPAPLQKETNVPCFVPGTTAPENYLKRGVKGFYMIDRLSSLELVKGSDMGKFLTGGIFDVKLESKFLEPALTAAQREKDKETAPNKDNAWKLPAGAKAWADVKPQFTFYLKLQSFDPQCAKGDFLKFKVLYTKDGKELSTEPEAVLWKLADADATKIGGAPAAPAGPGLTFAFHPTSTLYKNEAVLYSGVPLSGKIDKISIQAINCFGQTMTYTYHLRHGVVPKYVEERDALSGMFQGKLIW